MRSSTRRRRYRMRTTAERGTFCESFTYSGPWTDWRCPLFATGYQRQNDIYVCGVHARGYLHVEAKP